MKSKPNLAGISIEDGVKASGMEEVIEGYKQALVDFCEKDDETLTDALEQFLLHIAKTGDTLASWDKVQKVFVLKMKKVLEEFYENRPFKDGKIHSNYENDPYEEMKERLVQLVNKFESPPFTMQRLCELVTTPKKNYSKCEKFMRALEKNLMVVTSWNYPSRRNSEAVEQVNGGFETRASFSAVDRPWATLPHSPIATSAPTVPNFPPANQEDSIRSSHENSDDTTKSNSVEMSENLEKNDVKQDEKIDNSVEITPEQSNKETTHETPSESNEIIANSSVSEEVAVSPTSTSPASDSQVKHTCDSTTVVLTNTEKDALKEPLPGVGTLVEKHAVNKASAESASTTFDVPPVSQQRAADDIEAPLPSPKRKTPDDEVSMEVSTPVAKRLKSDSDVPMDSVEEA